MAKATWPEKKTTTTTNGPKKSRTRAQHAVASAEQKVDKAVSNVSQKRENKVTPEFRAKATEFASQADRFASNVESLGDELEQITDSIFPADKWTTATFDATYTKKISRLFIFRCLWLIIQGPIIMIRSCRYVLIAIVHAIYMFVTWLRNADLRKKQTRYRRHLIMWKAYLNALVDQRPELIVE